MLIAEISTSSSQIPVSLASITRHVLETAKKNPLISGTGIKHVSAFTSLQCYFAFALQLGPIKADGLFLPLGC